MKEHKIKIETTINLTDQDIDDLMVTVLEGGINYWCDSAVIKFVPDEHKTEDGLYASDIISLGGVLELCDNETEETYDLNLSKFLNGVKMVCERNGYNSGEELMDAQDAIIADEIIQYALFGEVQYS